MSRQLFQYHPTIGYHFIPGLKARVEHEGGGYLIRVNRAGFRCDHEFVPRREPGTFRVLLFGDSYTAGDGVSNRERYGDLLETLVPGLQVYNFALPGTGTDQHYLAWREFASGVEHDLLIVGVLVENIRRVAARFRIFLNEAGEKQVLAKPYFTLGSDEALELHHVPVPKEPIPEADLPPEEREHVDRGGAFATLRRAVNALGPGVKERIQRLSGYQPLPAYDDPRDPAWRLMKAILERWIRESGAPVIVYPVPLYQYIEETASAESYHARFAELDGFGGARVHDPLPDFLEIPKNQRRHLRFEKDVHPTPEGHRVLARSLARLLTPLVHGSEVRVP